MATTHLAQKLYDKSTLDAQAWRADLGNWTAKSAESGFLYGGSSQEQLWEMARDHLKQSIPAYFDWIDKEARSVSPSSLRRESVEQCVGAVVSHSRRIRDMAADMHQRLAKLDRKVDFGNWEGVNDKAIVARGDALLRSFGLDTRRNLASRLNHLVSDHPWFSATLSVIAVVISVASFIVAIARNS